MWKTGDPEMATPKRVRTHRPKHSDTSLSREWRINMANKKKKVVRLNVYRLLLFPIFGCCFDVFFCVARVLLAKNKCNTYIHTYRL